MKRAEGKTANDPQEVTIFEMFTTWRFILWTLSQVSVTAIFLFLSGVLISGAVGAARKDDARQLPVAEYSIPNTDFKIIVEKSKPKASP